ncbi:MAG: glycosyltransferase family 2 protein [Clostridiales bacterium]|nr:glycosyltransferase family 2 protein [Clostridiales bacterium]
MGYEAESSGVSVVMPAYNAASTIARAIESVLVQTYPTLELIIVNDCSSDGTGLVIEGYAHQDSRIQVFCNKEKQGVSASRNRGVREARYAWIAFLDSDDYWLPDKLEAQMQMIAADGACGLCFTASSFINAAGRRSAYILHAPRRVTYSQLLSQNVISCSSVLVRRSDLLAEPMVCSPMIHEDYASWLALLKKYPYASGVDRPLLVYQVSTGSRSGNKLRAARMQWNTYQRCGLPRLASCAHFLTYLLRSVRKYCAIWRQMQPQPEAAL